MAQGERIDILLEAEQFDEYGGWVLDSLFEKDMGSAYLMAHGLGKPVEDALTTFNVPREETYRLWARVKDWVPEGHPGRFAISIDGAFLSGALGADGLDWHWQLAGRRFPARGRARDSPAGSDGIRRALRRRLAHLG